MAYQILKRAFDVTVAGTLLAILLAPMGLIWLAIRARMGSPALFRQQRPGKGRRPFLLLKFRTMSQNCGEDGQLLSDTARLTGLGRFLRRTSLDELPQLVNVLRGEMSLVGPRPLLTRYLPYYCSRESLRFEVTPGITGWAQLNGRNHCPWDERLEMDAWYVENRSIPLDLWILLKTIVKVAAAEDVVVDAGAVVMDLDAERAARPRQDCGTRATSTPDHRAA
jgi:lipopolysaccharide/colanic/teichoic acid biosynthesis glycosyltransferase